VSVIKPITNPIAVQSDLVNSYYILVDGHASAQLNHNDLISCLDQGAENILSLAHASEVIGVIPSDRILLLLDVPNASAVSDKTHSRVPGVLLKSPSLELDLISPVPHFFFDSSIYVFSTSPTLPTSLTLRKPLFRSRWSLSWSGIFPWSIHRRIYTQERGFVTPRGTVFGGRARLLV